MFIIHCLYLSISVYMCRWICKYLQIKEIHMCASVFSMFLHVYFCVCIKCTCMWLRLGFCAFTRLFLHVYVYVCVTQYHIQNAGGECLENTVHLPIAKIPDIKNAARNGLTSRSHYSCRKGIRLNHMFPKQTQCRKEWFQTS